MYDFIRVSEIFNKYMYVICFENVRYFWILFCLDLECYHQFGCQINPSCAIYLVTNFFTTKTNLQENQPCSD